MLGTFALLFTNFAATIAIAVKTWYIIFFCWRSCVSLIVEFKGYTDDL